MLRLEGQNQHPRSRMTDPVLYSLCVLPDLSVFVEFVSGKPS